jgi:hypothetical protein
VSVTNRRRVTQQGVIVASSSRRPISGVSATGRFVGKFSSEAKGGTARQTVGGDLPDILRAIEIAQPVTVSGINDALR